MLRLLSIFLGIMLLGTDSRAVPIQLSLDTAIQQADIVVVGTLGKLAEQPPPRRGAQQAIGTITVSKVLKGPRDLQVVPIRTTVGKVRGPVQYKEGASGIWILNKLRDSDFYMGGNLSSLQPINKLDAVTKEIERQVR
jgi:hypothetical protein